MLDATASIRSEQWVTNVTGSRFAYLHIIAAYKLKQIESYTKDSLCTPCSSFARIKSFEKTPFNQTYFF